MVCGFVCWILFLFLFMPFRLILLVMLFTFVGFGGLVVDFLGGWWFIVWLMCAVCGFWWFVGWLYE